MSSPPRDSAPPEYWTRFLRRLHRRYVQSVGERRASAEMARCMRVTPRWIKHCLAGESDDGSPATYYRMSMIDKALTQTPYTLNDVYPEEIVARYQQTDQTGWCTLCDEDVPVLKGRCCWCNTRASSSALAA